jgi:DNA gyrase subunit B
MLSSAEIGTLVTALGTGIGRGDPSEGGFDLAKLRYHRIVIMTDADVDGSHIRTLLLTFFFRQMPELVERGHLYIAQPPLFRAKRGSEERYLKDERALEMFLLDRALENASLTPEGGAPLTAGPLRIAVDRARSQRALMQRMTAAAPVTVLEQAAIAGALSRDLLVDAAKAGEAASTVARRLDAEARPTDRGWTGVAEGGRLIFSRTLRGVTERYVLDEALLNSTEARRLDEQAAELAANWAKPALLKLGETVRPVSGPVALTEAVMDQGRKGLTIQRFKGLGEMNPDQLWETTLDPANRSLLQVRIGAAEEAGEIFATLMGDVVEPRREFIVENALKVANLDV